MFQSTSDTEVIIHLLARAEGASLVDQLPRALKRVKGATLLVLTPDRMVGVRDPAGFRPLSLGRLGEAWSRLRDLRAGPHGGRVRARRGARRDGHHRRSGRDRFKPFRPAERLQCVFEYVYFARPDSMLWGRNVHTVRKALGHQLAREYPVEADRHRGARLRGGCGAGLRGGVRPPL